MVVTVSEANQAVLADRYGIRAALVRCGVDPERWQPAQPDGEAPLRVVALGRWVAKKGGPELV